MATDIDQLRTQLIPHSQAVTKYETGLGVESDRAIAQVQGRMMMARRFPRDPQQALANIRAACKLIEVAEDSQFSFRRGNTVVRGPNIRIGELVAREWGNIECSTKELIRGNGESLCETVVWDLQTGTVWTNQFVVPHRRDKEDGAKDLTSDRDIYEMIANMSSRRVREGIFRVVPNYIVRAALAECELTIAEQNKKTPLPDRINKLTTKFAEVGVSEAMLAKWLKAPIRDMLETHYVELGTIYRSIKDHVQRVEDFFEPPTVADTVAAKSRGAGKGNASQPQAGAKGGAGAADANAGAPVGDAAKQPGGSAPVAQRAADSKADTPVDGGGAAANAGGASDPAIESKDAPDWEAGDDTAKRISSLIAQAQSVSHLNEIGNFFRGKHLMSEAQVKALKKQTGARVKEISAAANANKPVQASLE